MLCFRHTVLPLKVHVWKAWPLTNDVVFVCCGGGGGSRNSRRLRRTVKIGNCKRLSLGTISCLRHLFSCSSLHPSWPPGGEQLALSVPFGVLCLSIAQKQ